MKTTELTLDRIIAASAVTLILLTAFTVTSCKEDNEEEKIENGACRFAEYFFNCLYKDAMKLCTPESAKWLSYAASNISQEDIDILNSQKDDATCESTDIIMPDDTTAVVTMKVKNFLMMGQHRCAFKNKGISPLHYCHEKERRPMESAS